MSKRKMRTGPIGRSPRGHAVVADGVYNNAIFMHAVTCHVGNIVQVKTYSGAVWEGVFRTFSSQFEIVLEVATRVDLNNSNQPSLNIDSVVDKMIFRPSDIVCVTAKDVDLDYATRDTFQTDTAISRYNGQGVRNAEERQLEPWEPCESGGINGDDSSLEFESGANGWAPDVMFKTNEQMYGVTSTFDQSLTGYTLQLQKKDTADYKEAEAKAAEIAKEIENQPNYKANLEMENGDEEDRYAAVQRPELGSSSGNTGKYVPPAKRSNPSTGKLIQNSTVSPSGVLSQPLLVSPKIPPTIQSSQSVGNVYQQQSPQYPTNIVVSPQQNLVAVPLPPRTQQPSPPKPTSHINGGGDSKPPIVPTIQQQPQRIQRPPVTTPAYVMAANPNVPQQMMEAPPNINREPPQPPREQRPPRHREDPIQDLRKFSQDFKLVTSEPPPQQTNQISPPLEQLQQPPPPVIPQQQQPLIGKPPQQSPPQQQPPPSQITPPQQSEPITETMDKVSTAFKKSTLNPNAKEFVYNPKSNFTQRSPSTPSASRPHTPQTPHTSPYVPQAAVSMAPTGQQPMPMVMPAAYVVTSQPTYQPPPHSQSNRFRKVQLGGIRTDMAQQMQVAAATGQPLLAPAPLQQFVYPPGGLAPQPYQQVVRMYHESPPHQLQYLGPPPPSNTPSPAQHQQQGGYPGSQQQQPPPQQQQYHTQAPPPQGPPHQFPIMCPIPLAPPPHMMQGGMQYQLHHQAAPPHTPHHIQVILPQPPPQHGQGPQQ